MRWRSLSCGVRAATAIAKAAGIEVDRAIVVNEGEGYGLLLDPEAVTATQIKTPRGTLTLNVKTKEVQWDLAGRRDGSVVLEYMLLVGMQPVSALRVSLFLKKE